MAEKGEIWLQLALKKGPLADIKVIELGQIAAGPFAGMLLADLGADVVKVERPNSGDSMRQWPPLTTNDEDEVYSENFASVNRNKRSITVNLKDEKEVQDLIELCKEADVLLENYRPGVLKRLGLGYEDLKQINPALVYCSISGYGQTGPYSKKGAFDVAVQAISGLMSVTGEESGPPVKCGVPVGDFAAGLYAAYSILAALKKKEETNQGSYIDCSMLGSLLGISALQTSEYYGTGKAPKRLGSAHPRNAPYQVFESKDRPFAIAAGNDKLWRDVCKIVQMEELTEDPRFKTQLVRAKNQKELATIIQPVFLTKEVAHWLEVFDAYGIPCAPVNDFQEILDDVHVKSMNIIENLTLPNGKKTKTIGYPIHMSDYEFEVFRSPPKLGEHNEEVYEEWLNHRKERVD
ncbi:crotonobetainyl-CoA:carnitine CoA-transferase CaiB-like acyl-CoA transferase [Pseudogracilibacillus auburnensis]|uniref:Crotonobetainyl-CoA:carnitine CoA-transferase CaiB-like acyl-CoA transferase n=1 Tax=Pseudogracilibacillus auburnensis TaxID=1494959 RepID=A0A2V3W720_9BACI|nr:CoA transferase [Pseudogracilibacillus auburnensis]PXW90153.1 crotonobetainyl-CoA:carnitine CoA-transferase CaiB-like acyl-CoA transferase [Pseudogracilibacillus auburnensis]